MDELLIQLQTHYYSPAIRVIDENEIHILQTINEFETKMFFGVVDFIRMYVNKDVIICITQPVKIENEKILGFTNTSDLIFQNEVTFANCTFSEKVDFSNCIFHEKVFFDNTTFTQNIKFNNCEFHKPASFENAKFIKLVDFYGVTFHDIQLFYKTDFLDVAIFACANFMKYTMFIYNKVKSDTIISFENTTFYVSLDLSRSNFWCNVHYWSIEFINIIPTDFNLYDIKDDGIPRISKKTVHLRTRETFRKIKNGFTQEGNNIEALKFHSYEMLVYNEEANIDKEEIDLEERVILHFNKCSNNFGSSWSTGVIFTVISSAIFYTFFLISLKGQLYFDCSGEAVSKTFKYFLQFLNITEWDYKPFGISDFGTYGYTVFFIARIFIGYGYYQTIQAFRKYGSN